MPTDAALASRQHTVDQLIPEPLVMALTMVVDDKSLDRPSKVALAEGNHSVETLLLDRAHEAFGVRIGIRRPERRLHDPDSGVVQQPLHVPTPFPVAVTN